MAKNLDDDQNIFLPKRIKMVNVTASTMYNRPCSFRSGKVFCRPKTALIMASKNIIPSPDLFASSKQQKMMND